MIRRPPRSTRSEFYSPTINRSQSLMQSQLDTSQLVLTKTRLQELVREVDPNEHLDEDVEELLLQIADDFIESTVNSACLLSKHRNSSTLEVKDVQTHLERQWNMWIPGFGTDELRPYKRAPVTEAHKQRMALIRKTLKKY
uniref:Transcription initiation factor TFIID subunit 12 n=1 Tax=Lynceus sp. MCZ IZ 141354 TaxID=1930659 RepID=A0A9N6WTB5_9CRUS|nr:EOG090X0HZC [Lynceus sp. MCZ IZ 141354]